jgi:Mono-functional DNA-alkylating methyl methanesulfonate N-term
MSTRNSSKVAFDHVMDVVLERDDTSPLKRALLKHGYVDIHSIHSLSDDDIDFLSYDEPGGLSDVPILPFEKVLILTFLDFVIHKYNVNDPIGNGWTKITREEFDDFKTTFKHLVHMKNDVFHLTTTCSPPSIDLKSKASTACSPSAPKTSSALTSFANGITSDQTLPPIISCKDEKLHQSCHSSLDKHAAELTVLGHKSTPTVEEHVAAMMLSFMCTVVLCTVINHHRQTFTDASHLMKHSMVSVLSAILGDQRSRGITAASLVHCIRQTNMLFEGCMQQWEYRNLWDPGIKNHVHRSRTLCYATVGVDDGHDSPLFTMGTCFFPRRQWGDITSAILVTQKTMHKQKKYKFFGSIQTELEDISQTTVNIGTNKLEGVTFVESISLAYFDSSPLSNSLNVLKKGLLFVATEFGDHGLYRFERVAIPDDDGVATFDTTSLMAQEHPIMERNKTVILKSEAPQNAWINYLSSLTQLGKALHHRGIALALEQALLTRPFLVGHYIAMDDLALFVALGWSCALAETMETSSKFQYYSCTIRLINTV